METILQQIIVIFSEVFQTEIVKTTNFFDIGGDSLNAMELISAIKQQFDVDITIEAIYEKQTPFAIDSHISLIRQ